MEDAGGERCEQARRERSRVLHNSPPASGDTNEDPANAQITAGDKTEGTQTVGSKDKRRISGDEESSSNKVARTEDMNVAGKNQRKRGHEVAPKRTLSRKDKGSVTGT